MPEIDPHATAYPYCDYSYGLKVRELFAAMAMQGMISRSGDTAEFIAERAVRMADKLIEELNK